MHTPNPLGVRIRYARKRAGLSLDEFAASIGCPAERVERWERGGGNPLLGIDCSSQTLARMEEVLGVTMDWLEGSEPWHYEPSEQSALIALRLALALKRAEQTFDDFVSTLRWISFLDNIDRVLPPEEKALIGGDPAGAAESFLAPDGLIPSSELLKKIAERIDIPYESLLGNDRQQASSSLPKDRKATAKSEVQEISLTTAPQKNTASEKPSTLGQRIAHARKRANLSRGELADALGCSREKIYWWESESPVVRETPSLDTLSKMSEVLNVSANWLMGRDSPLEVWDRIETPRKPPSSDTAPAAAEFFYTLFFGRFRLTLCILLAFLKVPAEWIFVVLAYEPVIMGLVHIVHYFKPLHADYSGAFSLQLLLCGKKAREGAVQMLSPLPENKRLPFWALVIVWLGDIYASAIQGLIAWGLVRLWDFLFR